MSKKKEYVVKGIGAGRHVTPVLNTTVEEGDRVVCDEEVGERISWLSPVKSKSAKSAEKATKKTTKKATKKKATK